MLGAEKGQAGEASREGSESEEEKRNETEQVSV